MAFYELDDVFGYQDANAIKKLWPVNGSPVDFVNDEVWLDISVNPPLLKRCIGKDAEGKAIGEIINGASLQVRPDGTCIDIGNTDLDVLSGVGLFRGDNLTNAPGGDTGGWYVMNLEHSADDRSQMAWNRSGTADALFYMRVKSAGSWGPWHKIWTQTTDGSGGGLDADTIDGLDSSQFVRSDADTVIDGNTHWSDGMAVSMGNDDDLKIYHGGGHSYISGNTGNLYISQYNPNGVIAFYMIDGAGESKNFFSLDIKNHRASFGADGGIKIYNNGTSAQLQTHTGPLTFRSFHNGGSMSFNLDATDGATKNMMAMNPDTESVTILGNTVWHAGNDGDGSGLDADKVDGLDAARFLQVDAAGASQIFDTGTDLNQVAGTRICRGYGWLNGPSGTWYHIINLEHSYKYRTQMALNLTGNSPNVYLRIMNDTAWGQWYKVWTETSDGAGSGLDADKLDGLEGADFMQVAGTQTVTGAKTFTNTVNVNEKLVIPLNQPTSLENGCIWIG